MLLADFAASAVTYRVRVWTSNFALDDVIRDRIRTTVYYAFRRTGIVIPYPIQVEMSREDIAAPAPDPTSAGRLLETVQIFATLPLRRTGAPGGGRARVSLRGGETIVREGDAGSSMFVVARGELVVTLNPSAHEVARLGPGDYFGEMSLLTGAPRTASVTAVTDVDVLEITVDAFRQFVLANPAAVERIGSAVADRAAGARGSSRGPARPSPPAKRSPRSFWHAFDGSWVWRGRLEVQRLEAVPEVLQVLRFRF